MTPMRLTPYFVSVVIFSVAAPPVARAHDPDLAEKLRHCPVTVPGAKTELREAPSGIAVIVTAEKDGAVQDIRARARHLVEFTEAQGKTKTPHGKGAGGGFMRNCPIVTKATRLTATDVPGGSSILVEPLVPGDVALLRADVRSRLEELMRDPARVIAELGRERAETRLFSAAIASLGTPAKPMLVIGGFTGTKEDRTSQVAAYSSLGDGKWKLEGEYTWKGAKQSSVRNVAAGDLDGDGKDELVALGRVGEETFAAKAQLKVLAFDQRGLSVKAETVWQSGAYTHGFGLAIGDVDGDKKLEIVSGGFSSDGKREKNDLRVWKLDGGKLIEVAAASFDREGFASSRINSVSVGDLDGDGRAEIVTAGRNGQLKAQPGQPAPPANEQGEVTVWKLEKGKLQMRAAHHPRKGSKTRLRVSQIADVDGDGKPEVVTAGRYDAAGKSCLLVLRFAKDKLELVADADTGTEAAEIKDLVVFGPPNARLIATAGPKGEKPERLGHVQVWKLGKRGFQLEKNAITKHGDETRARAIVAWPGARGGELLTVGHALDGKQMIGQLLDWGAAP